MLNIKWGNKYSIYPFELSDAYYGEIIVYDKGTTYVKVFEKIQNTDGSIDSYEIENIMFKNFQKAMTYVSSELIKKLINNI